jgi:CheY-like chemotaxis protein
MTTLSATIPCSSPAAEATGLEKNHRILVVDDNISIHEDFGKILGINSLDEEFDAEEAEFFGRAVKAPDGRVKFDLSYASQGMEALELVRAAVAAGKRYSMIFTDVRMPPGWDGLETTLKLWEVDPDLQIVICTAYSDKSWEEMMETLGHPERVLILKKPFDTIEVLQLAHALTEKWSLLQASRHNTEVLEQQVGARIEAHASLQGKVQDAVQILQPLALAVDDLIGQSSEEKSRASLEMVRDKIQQAASLLTPTLPVVAE